MIYRKIEIKSKDDFPIKGDYWMHSTNGVFFYNEYSLPFLDWEDFSWYLQPISEEDYLREELIKFAKAPLMTNSLIYGNIEEYINDYLKTRKR